MGLIREGTIQSGGGGPYQKKGAYWRGWLILSNEGASGGGGANLVK